MAFGVIVFILGYAVFYWGLHHMPGTCRYSLWTLLGLQAFSKSLKVKPGPPVQYKTS